MSYSLDVNLLLHASDASSPLHDRARKFLDECAEGPDLLCLTWPTLMAYLRISTHPSIFSDPLTPAQAQRNLGELLALPHVRLISEQDGFWELYRLVTSDLVVRGNLVPDAHVATLLRQHGVSLLYTNDSDYHRFEFLTVRNPLSST